MHIFTDQSMLNMKINVFLKSVLNWIMFYPTTDYNKKKHILFILLEDNRSQYDYIISCYEFTTCYYDPITSSNPFTTTQVTTRLLQILTSDYSFTNIDYNFTKSLLQVPRCLWLFLA